RSTSGGVHSYETSGGWGVVCSNAVGVPGPCGGATPRASDDGTHRPSLTIAPRHRRRSPEREGDGTLTSHRSSSGFGTGPVKMPKIYFPQTQDHPPRATPHRHPITPPGLNDPNRPAP